MTKTEQLKAGLLAMGAKPVESRAGKHQCFSLELGTTVRNLATQEVTQVMKTWYVFLGRSAGLRMAKKPAITQSMPASAGFYAKVLSRGTSV